MHAPRKYRVALLSVKCRDTIFMHSSLCPVTCPPSLCVYASNTSRAPTQNYPLCDIFVQHNILQHVCKHPPHGSCQHEQGMCCMRQTKRMLQTCPHVVAMGLIHACTCGRWLAAQFGPSQYVDVVYSPSMCVDALYWVTTNMTVCVASG